MAELSLLCDVANIVKAVEDVKRWRKVYFFDFDDTLFATSDLKAKGARDSVNYPTLTAELVPLLATGLLLQEMFEYLVPRSQVFIVTNASKGWVDKCLREFMPNLALPKNVQIVSARHKYAHRMPYNPTDWKRFTFFDCISQSKINPDQIVCIGDSEYEHNGVRRMVEYDMQGKLPAIQSIWVVKKQTQNALFATLTDIFQFIKRN